jgi:hypothetical protein
MHHHEEVHMRTDWMVATTLASALLVGACGREQERPAGLSDDLKTDLAVASTAGGDLATAPRSYQRMRFVSEVEQLEASAPAKRIRASHHPVRLAARRAPAPDPSAEAAPDPVDAMAEMPEPTAAPSAEAPTPEPAAVIAQQPAPEPTVVPVGSSTEGSAGNQGHGWGGLLGGIIGAVVIRGGHGGVDKCDPRTDGRARPRVTDRPDFGLPLPTGRTFPIPGSRRR